MLHVINSGVGELNTEEFSLNYYIGDFIYESDGTPNFSLIQQELMDQIKVHPNPVRNTLFIKSEIPNLGKYRVYDMNGMLKKQVLPNVGEIDFSQYPEGIYFLEAWDVQEQLIGTFKVIKISF